MVQLTATTATKPSTLHGVITVMSEVELAGYEKNDTGSGKWDVIIPNPKSKKTPRLCLFVTSLIFLMVAAVVLVLVIKLSLSTRYVQQSKLFFLHTYIPILIYMNLIPYTEGFYVNAAATYIMIYA